MKLWDNSNYNFRLIDFMNHNTDVPSYMRDRASGKKGSLYEYRQRLPQKKQRAQEPKCERNAVQSIRGIRSCFSKSQLRKKRAE